MRYALLVTAAAAALLLASCSGAEEEVPQDASQAMASATTSPTPVPTGPWTAPSGTPVAEPGWTTVRFLNVTVSVPDGVVASPLAGYTFSPTDFYNRPVILVEPRGDDYLRVVIDAETGTIIDETGSDQERAVLQPALATVRLSPFDPKTAPWPYADTSPPSERNAWANIEYPVVDPATGISMAPGKSSGAGPSHCGYGVRVWNGRSDIFINACTGEAYAQGMHIDPADATAFERLLNAIEVKP